MQTKKTFRCLQCVEVCKSNFKSPIDGAKVFLSPEKSMQIQYSLNSDIVMQCDECTPYPATHDEAKKSLE
ncbi:tRNA-guanine transglycosylase, partial [Pseudoalteromonas sp. SIMBA_153]